MMIETLLHTLKQYKLNSANQTLIIAVSGGMDSVVLLHMLVQMRNKLQCQLHITTLNHGLRNDAGIKDTEFVASLAKQWQIPITMGQADVYQVAQLHQIGIEAAARKARYEFLASVANQLNSKAILTAHHADDQAETIFMHMLRGTGLNGLKGMNYVSNLQDNSETLLIRPLLDISRQEIETYCEEHQLSYQTDETNQDTRFLRNQIRLKLIPQLELINPQIKTALNRLSKVAQLELDYLETKFIEETANFIRYHDDKVLIEKKAFKNWHPAIQARCLQAALIHLKPNIDVAYTHIMSAIHIIKINKIGAVAQFPQHIQLRIDYEHLVIEPVDQNSNWSDKGFYLPRNTSIDLALNTEIKFTNWSIRLAPTTDNNHDTEIWIPEDAKIILRTRQPGDRIQPKGLGGRSQKLKQWMIDRKIPQKLRDFIPLLVVNNQIAIICIEKQYYVTEPFVTGADRSIRIYRFVLSKINH